MLSLRLADEADVEQILDLWRRAGAVPTNTDDAAAVAGVLAHPSAFVLLAFEDDHLAGSVIGGFDGWRGGIYRLAVAPECRHRQVGRRLVREAAARLETLGARRTAAIARADEPEAVAFWDAVGEGFVRAAPAVRYARG